MEGINYNKVSFYRYYNAHPKQLKTGDCVVRAYCTAMHKDYLEARRELNKAKKDLGLNSYKTAVFFRRYFKDKYLYETYNAEKGYYRMDGEMFAANHPEGTYLLRMAHHLTCCIDGIIYDTWDCSEKCVYCSWKIK